MQCAMIGNLMLIITVTLFLQDQNSQKVKRMLEKELDNAKYVHIFSKSTFSKLQAYHTLTIYLWLEKGYSHSDWHVSVYIV